jgi:hypothetical protein
MQHVATDEHRDGVVADEEVSDMLESPVAFAELAGRKARDQNAANACLVWERTSTARGSGAAGHWLSV